MGAVCHEKINDTLKMHDKTLWILYDDFSERAQEQILLSVLRIDQIEDLVEESIWVSDGNITKSNGSSKSHISLFMVEHLLDCGDELLLRREINNLSILSNSEKVGNALLWVAWIHVPQLAKYLLVLVLDCDSEACSSSSCLEVDLLNQSLNLVSLYDTSLGCSIEK